MAQRICQQDRIVSPDFAKSYKNSLRGYLHRTPTTHFRRFNSAFTPNLRQHFYRPDAVFTLPTFTPATLSLGCGKLCENFTIDVHPGTDEWTFELFDTLFFTLHNPLPTEFEQSLSRRQLLQRVPPHGDLELTEDNHQDLSPLLSVKTVVKYSSNQERG